MAGLFQILIDCFNELKGLNIRALNFYAEVKMRFTDAGTGSARRSDKLFALHHISLFDVESGQVHINRKDT